MHQQSLKLKQTIVKMIVHLTDIVGHQNILVRHIQFELLIYLYNNLNVLNYVKMYYYVVSLFIQINK